MFWVIVPFIKLWEKEVIMINKQNIFLKTISMITYEGAQVLVVTGPLEVFPMANRFVTDRKNSKPIIYKTAILAEQKGPYRLCNHVP